MAPKKSFTKTGIQFNNADAPSTSEMDAAAFASGEKDDIFAQLPERGYRKTVQAAGGQIKRGNFVMTMTGLAYEGDRLSQDEWKEMGTWLFKLRDSIQWMIGDWANLAEPYLNEWLSEDDLRALEQEENQTPEGKYKWLSYLVDYDYSTLRKFAHYSSKFPVFRRRNTLTYSHHVEVASLPDEARQEELLDRAEHGDKDSKRLSVRALRELVQQDLGKQLPSGLKTPSPPVFDGLERIKQELEPARWKRLKKTQKQELYNELQIALRKMEELGLD